MSAAVLEVDELVVERRAHRVLHGVSFAVRPGEVIALLGPNGAGKTTLLDTVTGRLRPVSGSVRVAGHDVVRESRACRRRIGHAGQEIAVFPTLTVAQNVSAWAGMSGLRGRKRAEAVDEVMRMLFLVDLADRQVRTLSGGEQRRVHCATAMVSGPDVLLLDEPTVGVDPTTRVALLDHIGQLAARGAAIVYSTHYLAEIENRTAAVVMLRQGRVIASGPATDLISRYCRSVIEIRVVRAGRTETVVVPTSDPAADLARLLADVRSGDGDLAGVEVRAPTLEDAYTQVVTAAEEVCGAS